MLPLLPGRMRFERLTMQDYKRWRRRFPVWAHLGAVGRKKEQKGTFGRSWAHLGAVGHSWAQLGTVGLIWAQLGSFGRSWAHLGINKFILLFWLDPKEPKSQARKDIQHFSCICLD